MHTEEGFLVRVFLPYTANRLLTDLRKASFYSSVSHTIIVHLGLKVRTSLLLLFAAAVLVFQIYWFLRKYLIWEAGLLVAWSSIETVVTSSHQHHFLKYTCSLQS